MANTSPRWQRRKEARPTELVAAALETFADRGFAATRLDEVARRAGVTKGTLYLYFKSKDELFKAVVREAVSPNLAQIEGMLSDPAVPTIKVLEQVLLFITGRMANSRLGAIPKLIIAEAGNFPDLARFYLEEVVHRGLGVLARILRRGIAREEFRKIDVDATVRCIIAPVLMTALWKHSLGRYDENSWNADAVCRAHIELLTRGLVAPGKVRR